MAKEKQKEQEVDRTKFLSSFRAHTDIAPQLHDFQELGGNVNELINDMLRASLPHVLAVRSAEIEELEKKRKAKGI